VGRALLCFLCYFQWPARVQRPEKDNTGDLFTRGTWRPTLLPVSHFTHWWLAPSGTRRSKEESSSVYEER
jgi:hypothetical protein